MSEYEKKKTAEDLEDIVDDATELAREFGLDPYPVRYWIIDQTEMNELIAYNGFQSRYPHWRWGMQFDRQQKQSQYLGGKAFEIVNNDNPAHAFLQASNSLTDQKAVITHVAAHADFFKNNQWFRDDPDAAAMLERHRDVIEDHIKDSDVDRSDVEKWIDNLLCIEDNIDQYSPFLERGESDPLSLEEKVSEMGLDGDVEDSLFGEEWFEENEPDDDEGIVDRDLLRFFAKSGMQYDEESERAVEFEEWQRDVIEIIRRESYYFAPQKMTKVMNEGWAALWESVMMAEAGFAETDEFVTFADHQSMVLNSPGFNPYKLGKEMWEFIENKENRREVVDNLLRIEGIKPSNFHDSIDFTKLNEHLDHRDSDDLAKKHYSLSKPQNRGFIKNISYQQLEEHYRYIADRDKFDSVEEAVDEVDYSVGWKKMRQARESNNDITFLDSYLTDEFLEYGNYFTYDYNPQSEEMEVSSLDAEDVKKKLLLKFSNFGKPTITVEDENYKNKGILLLRHEYNGVMLDWSKAQETIKRLFNLWGRPIHLKTIVKDPETKEEEGRMIKYDSENDNINVERLDWEEVEDIAATEVDYNTKPDEWT